jgi:hypothetical protein
MYASATADRTVLACVGDTSKSLAMTDRLVAPLPANANFAAHVGVICFLLAVGAIWVNVGVMRSPQRCACRELNNTTWWCDWSVMVSSLRFSALLRLASRISAHKQRCWRSERSKGLPNPIVVEFGM